MVGGWTELDMATLQRDGDGLCQSMNTNARAVARSAEPSTREGFSLHSPPVHRARPALQAGLLEPCPREAGCLTAISVIEHGFGRSKGMCWPQ